MRRMSDIALKQPGVANAVAFIPLAPGGVGTRYKTTAAFLTAFYTARLWFLTFWGAPRGDHHTHDHAHESPKTMLIPLGVLAVGVLLITYVPWLTTGLLDLLGRAQP